MAPAARPRTGCAQERAAPVLILWFFRENRKCDGNRNLSAASNYHDFAGWQVAMCHFHVAGSASVAGSAESAQCASPISTATILTWPFAKPSMMGVPITRWAFIPPVRMAFREFTRLPCASRALASPCDTGTATSRSRRTSPRPRSRQIWYKRCTVPRTRWLFLSKPQPSESKIRRPGPIRRAKLSQGAPELRRGARPASLDLAPVQNRWTGKIEVVAMFMAADGGIVGARPALAQTVDLNLSQPTYANATQHGLLYRNELKIPGKAVQVKISSPTWRPGKSAP